MSRVPSSPAQERPSRPQRTPLAGRNRLAVKNKEDGYVYRIVNANLENDPDRVERMQEAGYELVPSEKVGRVGDKRVDDPSPLGTASSISVGQGTRAVVMRIRKDWYDEDQRAKQAELDEIEQTMKRESKSDYGTLDLNPRR